MFEKIKEKLKDIYYTIYAKRYAHLLEENSNENGISIEVVPEEVKYKMLKEEMIEDKGIIISIIANLTSEEKRHEMIGKYIKTSDMTVEEILALPENIRVECTYELEQIIDVLKSIQDKNIDKLLSHNERFMEHINKGYITIPLEECLEYVLYQKISNIQDEEILKQLSEKMDINKFRGNIRSEINFKIKLILDSLKDEEIIIFLNNNKNVVTPITVEDISLWMEDFLIGDSLFERLRQYIFLERVSKIQNEEILQQLNEFINIEELSQVIDTAILANDKVLEKNYQFIIKKENKIKALLKLQIKSNNMFLKEYRELDEESKKALLNEFFKNENIDSIYTYFIQEVKRRGNRHFGYDFFELIKDYAKQYEIDSEILKKLYSITTESNAYNISEKRIELLALLEDEDKVELICDNSNYSDLVGNKITNPERIHLLTTINDDAILIEGISKLLRVFENKGISVWEEHLKLFLTNVSDEIKLKIIEDLCKREEYNFTLLCGCMHELTDSETIKEMFMNNVVDTEELTVKKFGYYNTEERIEFYKKVEIMLTELILKLESTDEILMNCDLLKYSDGNILTLLLSAKEETVQDILKQYEGLNPNIKYICENKLQEIKQLSNGIVSAEDRRIFYRQLLNEQTENLDKKIDILVKFQENHAEIGSTIRLGILEDHIINAFRGLENLEMIVRYPETQELIIKIRPQHLSVIGFVNEIFKDKTHNPNNLLNEVLQEAESNKFLLSTLSEYLNDIQNPTELEIENIINIILYGDRSIKSVDDVKNYSEIKAKHFNEIIKNGSEGVESAYLARYFNMRSSDAVKIIEEYGFYCDRLEETAENIPIKNYISTLRNIINCNPEILSIAYQLSDEQEEISRLESELLLESIREKIAQDIKESLYKTNDREKKDTVSIMLDGKQVDIDVFEPDEDFNMLVTVLDAYGEGDGVYEDYKAQWNTNKYADNQRICTSYIGNNYLLLVSRHSGIIFGFTSFANHALVEMAPYDTVSKNNELVTTTVRKTKFMLGEDLKNYSRKYSEVGIERQDLEIGSGKLQPNYIVCFASTVDDIDEESKKAAAQFNIPIVLIDREKIAQRELIKIEDTIERFRQTKDIKLINKIIEQYCTNKYGSVICERDISYLRQREYVNIEHTYFSTDRLKEIIEELIEIANGSSEILEEIKAALLLEEEKHYEYQREFYGPIGERGILSDILDKRHFEILGIYEEEENIPIQEIINETDNEDTQKEFLNRKETFGEDSYDIDDIKEMISRLGAEELEGINYIKYSRGKVMDFREKSFRLYFELLMKEANIDKKSIKVLIENSRIYRDKEELRELFSEEEINLLLAYREIFGNFSDKIKFSILKKYKIPEELWEMLILLTNLVDDAHRLSEIAFGQEKIKEILISTEQGKKFIKSAFQIQEKMALDKIYEIIRQEGFNEPGDEEVILSFLAKGRTPIELAQTLHEVNRSPIIKEKKNEER